MEKKKKQKQKLMASRYLMGGGWESHVALGGGEGSLELGGRGKLHRGGAVEGGGARDEGVTWLGG